MKDNRLQEQFAQIVSELTSSPEDDHTRCIVQALKIVANELSELNIAASQIMKASEALPEMARYLEKIRDQG